MNSLGAKFLHGRVKFKAADLVIKRKVKFTTGYEQIFQQKYLGSSRLFSACPKPVYELWHVWFSFRRTVYNYELVKDTLSTSTEFQMVKYLRTRNKNSIKHLVKWKRWRNVNSWVNALILRKYNGSFTKDHRQTVLVITSQPTKQPNLEPNRLHPNSWNDGRFN